MQTLNFFIRGKPEPKGRPRFTRTGHIYTPAKTLKWERDVAIQAKGKTAEPFTGAISITLLFRLPRPKSLPKLTVWHIKKPDLDNLVKASLDGLEGIIFKGDQQIFQLVALKQYCQDNESPGVVVEIKALG